MPGEKTKLYMRTARPERSSDFNEAVRRAGSRKPIGLWMRGVESVGFINGQPTIMVRLEDGAFEPLSELVVTEIAERRTAERPSPQPPDVRG